MKKTQRIIHLFLFLAGGVWHTENSYTRLCPYLKRMLLAAQCRAIHDSLVAAFPCSLPVNEGATPSLQECRANPCKTDKSAETEVQRLPGHACTGASKENTIPTQMMADEFNFLWSQIQNYMADADADVIPVPGQFQKNPRAHENKVGTSPAQKTQNTPPQKKRGILWTWRISCRKDAFFPGAHKIGAALSGPRIAGKNLTDTRLFQAT